MGSCEGLLGIARMDGCVVKELLGFGWHVKDFNHYSIFAKWIQDSFGDAQGTLAKT